MYRMKITLEDAKPDVWRLIDVPGDYSFWDLHVAVQDAMGWLDCHLHAFEPPDDLDATSIGIPEYPGDDLYEAGWDVLVGRNFREPGDAMRYRYDFGDDWVHEVRLEAVLPEEDGVSLPRCVDGAGACPPEDCGGVDGYAELLEILSDPGHPEHEEMMAWASGRLPEGERFRPDAFDVSEVRFDDPGRRLKELFEHDL